MEKNNPKISIIVPVYNQEKYLAKCLEDILKQTYKNFELICVDDGSKDESKNILKKYEKLDDRVKVLYQKNSGAAVARNKGLGRAVGDYILFLDSDDEFSNNLLKICIESINRKQVDILVYNYVSFDSKTGEESGPVFDFDSLPGYKVYNKENIPDRIFITFYNNAWTKLFKRDFLQRNKLLFDKDLRRAQDALFVNSALALANSIATINEPLVRYRLHDTQSWKTINKYPFSGLDFIKKLRKFLIKNKLLPKLQRSFDNLCISSMNYTLQELAPHGEFEKVFYECRKMIKDYNLPTDDSNYYYGESDIHLINIIMDAKPSTYHSYRALIREHAEGVSALRSQIESLNNIFKSKSWKITRPMRAAAFIKRKLR